MRLEKNATDCMDFTDSPIKACADVGKALLPMPYL
jgi:hypothetical protein